MGQGVSAGSHQQPVQLNINKPGFPTPTMKHEFWCTSIESFPEGADGPELLPSSEALPYYAEPAQFCL